MANSRTTIDRRFAGRAGPGDSRRARGRGRGFDGHLQVVDVLAVALPVVLAAVLSALDLGVRSIWLDESATLSIASQHGSALWHAIAHDGGNMAGYYLLLHVLIGWFGDGLVVLRVPSAVAVTVTVTLVGCLCWRLFDRRVAFTAGVLTAVSLPLVFWGQDARGYAVMAMFTTASFLALVTLSEDLAAGRRIRWAWLCYVVMTTLGAYSSFVAVLVVPAQLVWLVWSRRRLGPALSALCVSAVLCVPLMILAVGRGTGQLAWLERPGAQALYAFSEALTSAALRPNFHPTSTSVALLIASAVVVMFAVASRASSGDSKRQGGLSLVVCWLVVPIVVALVESDAGTSIFISRNLLSTLPAVAILLALGVTDRRLPSVVGVAALCGIVALRAVQLQPSYGVSPENWKAATAYLEAEARSDDCVAFFPSDGRMAFDYYLLHGVGSVATAPRPVLPRTPFNEVVPYVERYTTLSGAQVAALARSCSRLWLVSSHDGERDGTPSSRANYERFRALEGRLGVDFRRARTERFGWASAVSVSLYRSSGA